MKKRILLVKPPEKSFFNFGTFSLAVLAASVRKQADVSILDATDFTIDETVNKIILQKPDILGITAMGLTSVRQVELLINSFLRARREKSETFDVQIIVGGHGASMAFKNLLATGADIVVLGEGELTLQQIISDGKIIGAAGTACLDKGKIVVGPKQKLIRPLDQLFPPARDLMPTPTNGIHLMETSRGCPHSCGFCETTRFFGQTWRPFSPDRVVTEVSRLINKYNAWIIHFADDNFTANPNRVIEICEKLKRNQLPAFFMASARADDLISNPELIPVMASANILRISVGVETLDSQISKVINKPISFETYEETFKMLRKNGIFSVASFIIGIPGEKPEMRHNALRLAIKASPDSAHFLPFLPLPTIPLSTGQNTFDPKADDIKDAQILTSLFRNNKTVRTRLKKAAKLGGIRGLLSQAALMKKEC
jgi:anaerobic magnesium-protoporphyrin IX monomethyl ester cyclase